MNMNTSASSLSGTTLLSPEEKAEADNRSVYVGNVSSIFLFSVNDFLRVRKWHSHN